MVSSTPLVRSFCFCSLPPPSDRFFILSIDVIYMTLSYILTDPTSRSSQRCTSTLSEVFQSTISILPHLRDLVNLTDIAMSDDLVNQAVGIAIGPFFAADLPASGKGRTLKGKEAEAALTAVGGKSGLRALRLDALGLLRAVSQV
jgi:hypothetical protein